MTRMTDLPGQAGAAPATFPPCTFCRHALATNLVILDNQWACGVKGSRRPHLVCASCAAGVIAKTPESVGLFELHPVPVPNHKSDSTPKDWSP